MSTQTKTTRTLAIAVERAATAEPEIVISSESLDRQGDIVMQEGGDWSSWLKTGGPVLFAHDARSLPVAKGTKVWIDGQGRTRARFRWVEGDSFADRVRNVFKQGLLAASIGFLPVESQPLPNGRGLRFTKWTGIEFSLTPCPANPDAVAVTRSLGLPVSDDEIVLPLVAERALPESQDATWPQAVVTARQALSDYLASLGTEAQASTYDGLRDVIERLTRWLEARTGKATRGSGLAFVDPVEVSALVRDVFARELAGMVRTETRAAINRLRGRLD